MTRREGLINASFTSEDFDRIEIEPVSTSHSDINSTGSQQLLTDSQTNFRFTNQTRNDGNDRVPTPSNMVRRWSQNLSKIGKGKKTFKEKTIYSLPSRKVFTLNGQVTGSPTEIEIDRLVNEIEQNEALMEDSPRGEQMRMDTIRALPHSLTAKRRLKEKLTVSITRNSSRISVGFFRKNTARLRFIFVKSYSKIKGILSSIELWYDSMKEIEGHFGSGVGTYFKFLRWLFMLDLFLFVFTFSFISFPEILYDVYDENQTLPQRDEFKITDLFTAEGFIKSSVLFYGAYTSETINLKGSSYQYSIPRAYYLTNLCLYFITFIIISSSMARSYRKSFIETSGGIKPMYGHKIFCSWDFSISNLKASKLKKSSIFTELKEILSELNQPKPEYSKMWRVWIVCSQLTAHLLVCSMIAGLGVAMWYLLQTFSKQDESNLWYETLYVAIAVNTIMLILQSFFAWISKMEDYETPRRTLHITLMRNFLLEAVIIGVLISYWLTKDLKECWETAVGQEIYRLIIVDFFISGLGLPLLQLLQVLLFKKFWPSLSKPGFDISKKSLGLVFNQTLLWVGLLFSPMLSAVVTLKMILSFYIMKNTLIYLSKSPTELWKSAQTQTLYLVFTFLSLFGVIVSLGYIMTRVKISKCGPFNGHEYMFEIFINGVLQLKENSSVLSVIMTVTRPAVLGGILITMAVVAYYLRAKSKARGTMVKLLKNMLYLEAKDKEFLLMNIARITHNREWLFNDDDIPPNDSTTSEPYPDYAESSSTWNYRKNNPNRSETILRSRFI